MRRPLNVAFLHPDLGIGGAERLIVDAALCLSRAGHEVTLYAASHDSRRCFPETMDGSLNVRVHGRMLPMHLAQHLRAPASILRMIHLARVAAHARPAPDVVVCDLVAHVLPLVERWLPRAKRIFYCHYPDQRLTRDGGGLYRLYRRPIDRLESRGMGNARLVLANSEFTRLTTLETFPSLDDRDIRVLYPGVRSPISVAPLNAEASEPLVLAVQRFSPEKNAELLVDAFAILRDRMGPNGFTPCRLVIAGGYDERLRDNRETLETLRRRIAAYDLASQIELVPGASHERLSDLFARCRCVAYPATAEHFGIVPVEAMAAGRPVIAVDAGGPRETVVDGETGFLCAPAPEAFADAMERLLTEPALATAMGRKGPARARRFSPDAFCDGFRDAVETG